MVSYSTTILFVVIPDGFESRIINTPFSVNRMTCFPIGTSFVSTKMPVGEKISMRMGSFVSITASPVLGFG